MTKLKPPADRRSFADAWDEVEYLYDKVLYWLYERADTGKSKPYAERLKRLLVKADPKQEAIFGAECRSLIHEVEGDLVKAITQRRKEIRLIRRLHQLTENLPQRECAERYDYQDLSDRLDLLATLYQEKGNLDKAIETLRESKQVCTTHALAFDGEDILQECLEEKMKEKKLVPRTKAEPAASVAQRRARRRD
ncbi:MAG: hypothetical protein U0793_03840 [Gemmataceae bacterium]